MLLKNQFVVQNLLCFEIFFPKHVFFFFKKKKQLNDILILFFYLVILAQGCE